jgi:hypothetical protein
MMRAVMLVHLRDAELAEISAEFASRARRFLPFLSFWPRTLRVFVAS